VLGQVLLVPLRERLDFRWDHVELAADCSI
jgi:hypothetical protein